MGHGVLHLKSCLVSHQARGREFEYIHTFFSRIIFFGFHLVLRYEVFFTSTNNLLTVPWFQVFFSNANNFQIWPIDVTQSRNTTSVQRGNDCNEGVFNTLNISRTGAAPPVYRVDIFYFGQDIYWGCRRHVQNPRDRMCILCETPHMYIYIHIYKCVCVYEYVCECVCMLFRGTWLLRIKTERLCKKNNFCY